MERLVRIANFWGWLPAFRAVAELQHLPTAARALHVSPSALSRAVRLLEGDLGRPLFERTGRRLVLNEAGRRFLDRVRDAMELVHGGSRELEGPRFAGRIRIASAGLLTTAHVVPVLRALRHEHPELVPVVESADPGKVTARLRQGELDVAFLSVVLPETHLARVDLGQARSSVYCGRDHPLHGQKRVSLDDVLAHDFVAPVPDAEGRTQEGWPEELPRRIGMHVDQMRIGLEICAAGDLLAVLPDAVAAPLREEGALRRLPFDGIRPTPLFAFHRPTLGPSALPEAIVAAVRDHVAAAT